MIVYPKKRRKYERRIDTIAVYLKMGCARELNASIFCDLYTGYVHRNVTERHGEISRYSGKSCWSRVKWPVQPNDKNRTTDRFRCTAFVAMEKFLSRVHLSSRTSRDMYGTWERVHPASRESQAIFPCWPFSSARYRNSILFAGVTCTTRVIRFANHSSAKAHSQLNLYFRDMN